MTAPYYQDPSITCDAIVCNEDEETGATCGKTSCFIVSRSDSDTGFGAGGGTEEACEEHLAEAVAGMTSDPGEAEAVQAVVSVRWHGEESAA